MAALRDTSWAATAGSPRDSTALQIEYSPHNYERITIHRDFNNGKEDTSDSNSGEGKRYYRDVSRGVREWILMSKAGAMAAVDTLGVNDTTVTYTAVEVNRITGAWKVVETTNAIVAGWTGE